MMKGGTLSLRAGVCVAIWVVVVARAGAQSDNLRQPDTTAWSFTPTQRGAGRYINGPTGTSLEAQLRTSQKSMTPQEQGSDGSLAEEDPNVTTTRRGYFNGHTYNVNDDAEKRPRMNTVNSHTGGGEMWAGAATQEGPRHTLGEEQVKGTSSDLAGDGNPGSDLNAPRESESSPSPDVDAEKWTWDSDKWAYREGEWAAVHLPDPAFPSLPTPHLPTAALIAIAQKRVEAVRNVSGMSNVTLHYRYFLSENADPDTTPELKVYFEVNGTRQLLKEEKKQGEWSTRSLHVPVLDISSILFEGWVKRDGDLIALSNVDTLHVRNEPLDEGDQLTLTTKGEPNIPEDLPSTPPTEQDRTQGRPASEVFPAPDMEDQANNTNNTPITAPPTGTQGDQSSTANPSQSTAGEEMKPGDVTEVPLDPSDLEARTDSPVNETRTSEQMTGGLDAVALNSSMPGGDDMTLSDNDADYFTSRTTSGGGKSGPDDEASTTPPVMNAEANTSENKPETVMGTNENVNNSSSLSIPGVTPDALQINANTTTTLPAGGATNGPASSSGMSGNSNATEGQDVSTTVQRSDELTSGTTLVAPQPNETSNIVTSPTGVTISIAQESTTLPSAAGNNTEAVTAVPVSNTSWQVFQVFLVLCVLGLLALGLLYWKKKRRQDDEIPVFTRHTDYPNPTFSMEDAANFMTRGRRNTYKTIE